MLDNNGKIMMTAENEKEVREENEQRVEQSFKQANEDSWGGSIP
jgi:hypothetical protein